MKSIIELPFHSKINIEIGIEIGKVMMAHQNMMDLRFYVRQEAKKMERSVESAKKDLNQFGMYSDCGPTYEAAYEEAKTRQSNLDVLNTRINRNDRYFKLLRHEFYKNYPDYKDILDDEVRNNSVKVRAYLTGKLNKKEKI